MINILAVVGYKGGTGKTIASTSMESISVENSLEELQDLVFDLEL